jgi:predicted Zn-dependent protease
MSRRLCFPLWLALALSAQPLPDPREAALGDRSAQEIRQRTTALDAPAVAGYVEAIGRKLAAQLPDSGFPYRLTVIAGDVGGSTHEPVALPGGYVFVPAALILAAQSEAEFAGMLAHAMAHAADRHGSIAPVATIPLIWIGGWWASDDSLVPLSLVDAQRRSEMVADRLAVQTSSAAGYDPEAFVHYLSRVQRDSGRSRLPIRDARIAVLEQAIQALPPRTASVTDDLPPIREEVRRLIPQRTIRPPSLFRSNSR